MAQLAIGQGLCRCPEDALIQDMKTSDMYVGNLENQGLVRLIQHLGIDARQRADILSKASIQEMQQSLLERIEVTTFDSTIASGRQLVFVN